MKRFNFKLIAVLATALTIGFASCDGGGIDYKLTDKLVLNAELKYKISDTWDRLLLSAGLAYKF